MDARQKIAQEAKELARKVKEAAMAFDKNTGGIRASIDLEYVHCWSIADTDGNDMLSDVYVDAGGVKVRA